jgi:hypothetical protein
MSKRGGQRRRLPWTLSLGIAAVLLLPAGAVAASLHPTLLAKGSQFPVSPSVARSADGTLHLAYETNTNWGDSANGVGAVSISPSGHVGPQVQALSWSGLTGGSPNGIPGLATMPGGGLEAVFGGSPSGAPGPFGISSSNGGSTWSAPVDVGSHSNASSVGGGVTLQVSGITPVIITGCCGGISVQQGFGPGSPTYQLTNSSDGVAGNVDSAVDAATGAVIAGWDSSAGSGGFWFQQVAPTEGTAQQAPVPSQIGPSYPLIVAGRDSGPGVFAAYPADYANTTHIRLLRYGGGSVGVGSVKNLHADVVGVATGLAGRIWVMWSGQINGKGITAITRSNKAVTRFEPIQQYRFTWGGGITLSGDGRLGPLDLLIDGTPFGQSVQGIYYARTLPVLSASVSAKSLGGGKFKLRVKVTDAGDAVSGATASAKGQFSKTSKGKATLTISGLPGEHVTVKIGASGYRKLSTGVTL